jgi:hypothetical protein
LSALARHEVPVPYDARISRCPVRQVLAREVIPALSGGRGKALGGWGKSRKSSCPGGIGESVKTSGCKRKSLIYFVGYRKLPR